jgi:hypothetical protein
LRPIVRPAPRLYLGHDPAVATPLPTTNHHGELDMSSMDKRGQDFERKYALDEEQKFKATNRRNKLLGLWAAEKMGLGGDEAAAYAKDVVASDFEEAGDDDVLRKVLADLGAKGVTVTEAELRTKMDALIAEAVAQVKAGS